MDKSKTEDKTVLFVDDDELILRLMNRLLKLKFKDVYLAKNGLEGLEKFKELRPDMVISDLIMPRLNGEALSKEIKSISKETPVVIITAFQDEEINENYIDYKLSKPVDKNMLFEIIDKVL